MTTADPSAFDGHNKVTIQTLILTSAASGKSVDIRSVASQFELYMSIYDPTVVGSVSVRDSSGLLQNLPMLGEETLYIEISTPGHPTYTKLMYVYHIDSLDLDPNGAHINFILRFASIDQYNAITSPVAQSFSCTISDMVTSILKNKLKTTQELDIEPTNGIETLVIPHWNCWKAIDFLRGRAVSTKYNSPFIFFEDVNGYHFGSIEYFVNKGLSSVITFTADPWLPNAGDEVNRTTVMHSQYRNAMDLVIESKANSLKMIHEGGMSSRTLIFDILDKSVKTIDTTYNDQIVNQSFGSKFFPNHSSNFVSSIGKLPPVQHMIALDSGNQTMIAANYGKRKLYAAMLNENKISFSTPGDIALQPGQIIQFNAPQQINSNNDQQLTGQFIIGNMRHGIFSEQMMTTIDAFRTGFSSKVL